MTKPLSFLIADDDQDDRELFESILRQEAPDAIVTAVADGTEVLSYLKSCPELYLPDALILDYNMPLMTGAQVLDAICSDPKYYGVAKFMLSTSSQPEYKDGCIKKGAIEYFVKATNIVDTTMIANEIISYCRKLAAKKS
jgi:CheY-like chemotaxis protein